MDLTAISTALVVIGASYGIGKIGSSAMDAMARQPEASKTIQTTAIVVAALVEGVALFGVVVTLLLGN